MNITVHVIHGGFASSLGVFGEDVVNLVVDLHNFFMVTPLNMKKYRNKLIWSVTDGPSKVECSQGIFA